MPNHLHILAQVIKSKDLAKLMQGVLQVYAHYFRKKYASVGFVFQNRYKSRHIDSDAYLLECGRYIERNPLRAGLVSDLSGYPWSSFLFYAKGIPSDIIKFPNPLYASLGITDLERHARYSERVLEIRPYEHIVDKEFRIR
jgi:putative transposase